MFKLGILHEKRCIRLYSSFIESIFIQVIQDENTSTTFLLDLEAEVHIYI